MHAIPLLILSNLQALNDVIHMRRNGFMSPIPLSISATFYCCGIVIFIGSQCQSYDDNISLQQLVHQWTTMVFFDVVIRFFLLGRTQKLCQLFNTGRSFQLLFLSAWSSILLMSERFLCFSISVECLILLWTLFTLSVVHIFLRFD